VVEPLLGSISTCRVAVDRPVGIVRRPAERHDPPHFRAQRLLGELESIDPASCSGTSWMASPRRARRDAHIFERLAKCEGLDERQNVALF